MSRVELLSNACGFRACQPGWWPQDHGLVPTGQYAVSSVIQNLRQTQNEFIQSSRTVVQCYLWKPAKAKAGENQYMSIFCKSKMKKNKSLQCHFYGLSSLESKKAIVYVPVCISVCVCVCVLEGQCTWYWSWSPEQCTNIMCLFQLSFSRNSRFFKWIFVEVYKATWYSLLAFPQHNVAFLRLRSSTSKVICP